MEGHGGGLKADYIRRMSAKSDRQRLSVVIITLNAAHQLEDCLASVGFADEIVILDSGSSDASLEVAARHGARASQGPWLGFGPQKQKAVALARHDWVLCLDADERVTPELAASIRAALVAPDRRAYRMARANRFMGRVLRHGEGYPDWSLRLFHRAHARWSDDTVHEKVLTSETVGTLAGDLLHDSAESLATYLAKQDRYTTLQAEALARTGATAGFARIGLSPLLRFFKFYLFKLGFLDGIPGLVHIAIGCRNSMMKYAKLRSLRSARRRGNLNAP